MPEKKYDLIITSVESDAELTVLSQKLGKALRKNPQQIEFALNEIACLSGADFPIIQGIAELKAKQLQAFLAKQGIDSKLRAEIGLELMVESTEYFCPACGHGQEKAEDDSDVCASCGVIGKKYANIKKRKAILESERRRHQAVNKLSADENRKQMERQEEEILREEARKKLGIHKQKKPLLLASFIVLFGIGSVTAYLYQDELLLVAGISNEQEADSAESAGTKIASSGAKTQKPMLMVPANGGNITLKMPEGSASSVSPMESSQSTVATVDNMPAMTDSESQSLALQMYQERSEEQAENESKLKATLVAHGIDNPRARKAVLDMMGRREASIDQSIVDSLTAELQHDVESNDPYLDELQMLVDSQLLQGNHSQAVEISKKAKNKYQEAVLLHDIVQAEIKTQQDKQQIDSHISHMAKLIWNEPNPVNQVKIQGLLSTAYDLSGEKKIASLNLVMAVEKLRFVDKAETKVELLCQLSKTQRAAGNINQAREILKLAEEKTSQLVEAKQAKAYADIANDYALALDFSNAMSLTEKISNPSLLKDTLRHITEIQGKYMSLSNPPV